jgi:hypothetical protein
MRVLPSVVTALALLAPLALAHSSASVAPKKFTLMPAETNQAIPWGGQTLMVRATDGAVVGRVHWLHRHPGAQ